MYKKEILANSGFTVSKHSGDLGSYSRLESYASKNRISTLFNNGNKFVDRNFFSANFHSSPFDSSGGTGGGGPISGNSGSINHDSVRSTLKGTEKESDDNLPIQSGQPYFLLGPSVVMRKLMRDILFLNGVDNLRVLIVGAPGSGKEPIARFIREHSYRKSNNLIELNCSEISNDPNSALSKLFGHEKDVFTGANKKQVGLVEKANNGTLILDEVDQIPLIGQAQLLRFMETKKFNSWGSDERKPLKSDVRIISMTNADLHQKIKEGTFREDFYSRISDWIIRVPSLNERKEDIPFLARHFLADPELSFELFKNSSLNFEFYDDCEEILVDFDYPRNVRQLKKVINDAMVIAKYTSKNENRHIKITADNLILAAEKAEVEIKTQINLNSIINSADEQSAIQFLNQIEEILIAKFSNSKKVIADDVAIYYETKDGKLGITRQHFSENELAPRKEYIIKVMNKFPNEWKNARMKCQFIRCVKNKTQNVT